MRQATSAEKQKRIGAAGLKAFPRIAKAWGLKENEAARLLGKPASTYRRWKMNPETAAVDANDLERLSLILGIYKNLEILLPDRRAAQAWVKQPNDNPLFGGAAPIRRMLGGQVGDLFVVRQYLDGARGG